MRPTYKKLAYRLICDLWPDLRRLAPTDIIGSYEQDRAKYEKDEKAFYDEAQLRWMQWNNRPPLDHIPNCYSDWIVVMRWLEIGNYRKFRLRHIESYVVARLMSRYSKGKQHDEAILLLG